MQVSALRMIDRERGQIDGLLNALAQDLPAKALPVIVEIISNHMDVLNFRSAKSSRDCKTQGRPWVQAAPYAVPFICYVCFQNAIQCHAAACDVQPAVQQVCHACCIMPCW